MGAGLTARWSFQQTNGGTIAPELRAEYRYDLVGDVVENTSSFTGGGESFQTKGFDPARHNFNLGASVTYTVTDRWEFTANYDYLFKEDYDSHSGFIRTAYKF